MQPVKDTPPPPSYDHATQDAGSSASPPSPIKHQSFPRKSCAHQQTPPTMQEGPAYAPYLGTPTVHRYVNPLTGEHVITVLPPDHPEMVCLQNGHVKQTKFGLLGTLAAVFWFPLGIALCLMDRRVTCQRCGRVFEDGVTCG